MGIIRELALAIRHLANSPAFAVTAATSLALGIGASTAVFSVANGVLLRPLPYPNPDRLVFVMSDLTARTVRDYPLSNADFIDLRASGVRLFDDLTAVVTGRSAVPQRDGSLEEIRWARVTPSFFHVMGARMRLGRAFTEADGQLPPASEAAGAPASTKL